MKNEYVGPLSSTRNVNGDDPVTKVPIGIVYSHLDVLRESEVEGGDITGIKDHDMGLYRDGSGEDVELAELVLDVYRMIPSVIKIGTCEYMLKKEGSKLTIAIGGSNGIKDWLSNISFLHCY